MNHTFITELSIKNVRHINSVDILLSSEERKNLILTGKNGSGKTSVLESLVAFLNYIVSDRFYDEIKIDSYISMFNKEIREATRKEPHGKKKEDALKSLKIWEEHKECWTTGCIAHFASIYELREKYQNGRFVLGYYGDNRKINVTPYKNIERVELKEIYSMTDRPSKDLGKYLVNLKSTQAFAQTKGDYQRAQQIENWFDRFVDVLRKIYKDDTLKLEFDIDTFQFSICVDGREPFTFNTMSMGYAAVFDIVSDLIMRMEVQNDWSIEGIVLIDEVETHLHVELQKEVVPILMELFPNIQFIITTHSPFVLSSAENAVVYDLERRIRIQNGLTNLPYEGIVEGYFNVDLLSQELREKFEQYKELIRKPQISDLDYAQISELEYYLDEVPDYLAVDFAEEYSRLKNEIN